MIEIGLTHYLFLASIIFTIGVIGIFLNRKNMPHCAPKVRSCYCLPMANYIVHLPLEKADKKI